MLTIMANGLMPSGPGLPMLPTMPPVEQAPLAPPMGAPPMGPPGMGAPPMGGGFPSTDPMQLIMGITGQQDADQQALAQQQQVALQVALSALIDQMAGMPDPAAAAAMSEPGPVGDPTALDDSAVY